MTRLAEIERQIGNLDELRDIVGAMRSLAGMHMQEAQRTLPGIRRYAASVASGIADAMSLARAHEPATSEMPQRRAVVLCMAQHGFVGGFNERLLEKAQATLAPRDALFVLGSRGAALVQERGMPTSWAYPMATRCTSAPDTVQHLSAELYRRIARREIARVDVIHTSIGPDGGADMTERLLLPLDMTALRARQARQPPLHNLSPAVLLEKLMAEYVFALLTEAAVESIASENAARLAAMEAAHDNVARKLDGLRQDARHARQSEITTEILELVTAAKALEKD